MIKHLLPPVMTLKVFIEGKALADVISAAIDLKQVWGRSGGYKESKTVRQTGCL